MSANDPYTCVDADVITTAKRNYLKNNLIPAAVSYLQAALSVIPVQGSLVMPNPYTNCGDDAYVCCTPFWPAKYISPGQDGADYVLAVTARPTSPGLLAWALGVSLAVAGRAYRQS